MGVVKGYRLRVGDAGAQAIRRIGGRLNLRDAAEVLETAVGLLEMVTLGDYEVAVVDAEGRGYGLTMLGRAAWRQRGFSDLPQVVAQAAGLVDFLALNPGCRLGYQGLEGAWYAIDLLGRSLWPGEGAVPPAGEVTKSYQEPARQPEVRAGVGDDRDAVLLETLREVTSQQGDGLYRPADIGTALRRRVGDGPAAEWVTPEWVGRALKRLGFHKPEGKRRSDGVRYMISRVGVQVRIQGLDTTGAGEGGTIDRRV